MNLYIETTLKVSISKYMLYFSSSLCSHTLLIYVIHFVKIHQVLT